MWDAEEKLTCYECKHYCNANPYDKLNKPCQHRIDHKHVKMFRPSFATCYDNDLGKGRVCSDFEPAEWCKYVYAHWEDFDTYVEGYKTTWGKHGHNFWTGKVYVYLNDHLYDHYDAPAYALDAHELVYGHPYNFETGDLHIIGKMYNKRCKKSPENPLGFKLIHEDIDTIINVFEEGEKYETSD